MPKILPDDKAIPFTHEARIGVIKIPKVGGNVKTILIEDTISEHISHLTKHFEDEATVTLIAYHKYTENGLIFDLEVGGKNYRYMFKVTPEMLNTINDSKSIVIYNSNEQSPLFLAYVGDCQNSINQLTGFMLMTEADKLKDKNKDRTS